MRSSATNPGSIRCTGWFERMARIWILGLVLLTGCAVKEPRVYRAEPSNACYRVECNICCPVPNGKACTAKACVGVDEPPEPCEA